IDRLRREEFTENWNIRNARNLVQLSLRSMVQESGDTKRLPVLQLNFRFRTAGRQSRNNEARNRNRICEVQRRYLRRHVQSNHVVGIDCPLEVQLDTKGTELNCHCTHVGATLHDWKWELAAGQETGFLSV